jgi:hypothetical protein
MSFQFYCLVLNLSFTTNALYLFEKLVPRFSKLSKKTNSIGSLLFANGFGFLGAYLSIYLLCWLLHAPLLLAVQLITIANLLLCYLLVRFSIASRHKIKLFDVLFWASLFLFFLLPGAYLEYPSDSWEHFRRILNWQSIAHVGDYPLGLKSWYFFAWSILHWLPMESWRGSLNWLSALTQLLVAYQIFLLSKTFGFSKLLSFLQTACFFLFFGTTIFGFRYYALSSMPFAFVGYLGFLIVILQLAKQKITFSKKVIFKISFCLLLTYFNHTQEIVFALFSTIIISLMHLQLKWKLCSRRNYMAVTSLLAFISYLGGWYVFKFYPQLFNNVPLDKITDLGTAKFWRSNLRIYSTLGVHGWIALALCFITARKYPYLTALTAIPFLCFIFPPTFLALSYFSDMHSAYRILYAFPTSLVLVVGLLEVLNKLNLKFRYPTKYNYPIAIAILLFLSANPSSPWFGRLAFQLHQPSQSRELKPLDATAQWFSKNRSFPNNCFLEGDGPVLFSIFTYLGKDIWIDRIRPRRPGKKFKTLADFTRKRSRALCGILVADINLVPDPQPSWVSEQSKHWDARLIKPTWYYGQDFLEMVAQLPSLGWTKTKVPPYYWLYEPGSSNPQ